MPLNVGYITAALKQRLGNTIDAKIFKFPDNLIQEIKSSPPDILALSNYDWNVNSSSGEISSNNSESKYLINKVNFYD